MGVTDIHRKPRNNMLDLYSQSKIGPFCISYQLSCWFVQTLSGNCLFPPTRSTQFRFHSGDKKHIYFYPAGFTILWEKRMIQEDKGRQHSSFTSSKFQSHQNPGKPALFIMGCLLLLLLLFSFCFCELQQKESEACEHAAGRECLRRDIRLTFPKGEPRLDWEYNVRVKASRRHFPQQCVRFLTPCVSV